MELSGGKTLNDQTTFEVVNLPQNLQKTSKILILLPGMHLDLTSFPIFGDLEHVRNN